MIRSSQQRRGRCHPNGVRGRRHEERPNKDHAVSKSAEDPRAATQGCDGAYAASNTIRALEFFKNTLPRHQRELKLRRQFSARSSDAVEAVDLQPLSREAAPKMLRMLELGMRKAGAGAGLADSPLARGADDRETRFGTRSEWADFADFAKERKGKDHAYERAKAEKAMAEGGDGWRPGAHDEALDSLLDRFDDADDPIVMRELAPTPEVTFDVADMPEAPPDGRPLLFSGPPPGGRAGGGVQQRREERVGQVHRPGAQHLGAAGVKEEAHAGAPLAAHGVAPGGKTLVVGGHHAAGPRALWVPQHQRVPHRERHDLCCLL